jgi:hypothetical protein
MQMGSWEGNEICKHTPTHTHTHTHTHMSTLCVADRDLGFAFFGAWSLPGRSPFSSPTTTLPAISKFLLRFDRWHTQQQHMRTQLPTKADLALSSVCEWMWGPLWPERPGQRARYPLRRCSYSSRTSRCVWDRMES